MAVCRRPDGSDSQTSDGVHQQAFLCSNIADSTFPHPPGGWSALSLQNGKLAAGFLFVQLLSSSPFLRRLSALLLQSHWIARSRESVQDSCRPVKPCRDSHRLENGVAIFADSEQSSRPSPFSPERSCVWQLFHSFCILHRFL